MPSRSALARGVAMAQDPAIFISLVASRRFEGRGNRSSGRAPDSSLLRFGDLLAVKDNIDVAGLDTTAACPAFAYRPEKDAAVVARLRAAGALVIGKTNLDQFATGLSGTAVALWRTPFGVSCGVCVGRIELGFGGRGRGRSRSLCTRHRHGWLSPGAGGVQQSGRD